MLKLYQVVYIGLELLIALLAVAGNILVCWSVCLNSNLQSITNFFVVSLAVADIAVGLLAIPFAITISVGFCANFYGCLFIACFVLVLTQSSIFSLLAIALDRYIAIKNPLRQENTAILCPASASKVQQSGNRAESKVHYSTMLDSVSWDRSDPNDWLEHR
ncbi:Adenosine receptor A2a [Ataeniobius toweri]|uniref:Adenosine receptor A2a n=1 Tax=Ataeniobius toweri TaxID=208326 RepID=A0ABU7CAP2_9TELE|nr:Adenosine receptor A2a [Ataeniobius toweri]